MAKKEFSIAPHLIYREEVEDAVLCNSDTFDLVMLNQTGNFIWKLIEKGLTRGEIVEEMVKTYDGADSGAENFGNEKKSC